MHLLIQCTQLYTGTAVYSGKKVLANPLFYHACDSLNFVVETYTIIFQQPWATKLNFLGGVAQFQSIDYCTAHIYWSYNVDSDWTSAYSTLHCLLNIRIVHTSVHVLVS